MLISCFIVKCEFLKDVCLSGKSYSIVIHGTTYTLFLYIILIFHEDPFPYIQKILIDVILIWMM